MLMLMLMLMLWPLAVTPGVTHIGASLGQSFLFMAYLKSVFCIGNMDNILGVVALKESTTLAFLVLKRLLYFVFCPRVGAVCSM